MNLDIRSRLRNWKSVERVTALIVSVIFFIGSFIYLYNSMDTTPKPQEYADELTQIIDGVKADPSTLLSRDCSIIIRRGITTYTVENAGYRAIATFDTEYNVTNLRLDNKAPTQVEAVFLPLIAAIMIAFIIFFAVLALTALIRELIFALKKK